MADENNEDMSMEDILSSIKDILSEDPQINSIETTPEETVVEEDVVADSPVDVPNVEPSSDDVLDLSPAMRISSPFSSSENVTEAEVAVDVATDDVVDFSLDDETDVNLDAMLDNSDPIFDIADEHNEDRVLDVVNEVEVDNLLDADSDPFYEENISTTDYNEPEVAPIKVAPVIVHEIEPEIAETLAYEVEEPQSVAQMDPVIVHEIEPEETVAEPTPAPVAPKAETVDAVDVSANIISNFAKMFAKEETPVVKAEPKPEYKVKVENLGESSKTITDVVADVIRDIIGDEVATNWRQGADYSEFAAQEIQYQTKVWLDANLPVLVERIVKQEIERVMAKVGNNQ